MPSDGAEPAFGPLQHRRRGEHRDDLLPVDPDLAPDDPGEPSRTHRPVPHVRRGREHAVVAAIGLGGFVGTAARYGVGSSWKTPPASFPWATFTINSSGALVLGLGLTLILASARAPRLLRPFACVGLLGAWTTMSTLAVESDLLVGRGHPVTALVYVLATACCGIVLSWAGIAIGRRWSSQGEPCSSR